MSDDLKQGTRVKYIRFYIKYSSTMAVYQVNSCSQGENWTATAPTAAAELASEPAIPDLETWGSGPDPFVLASFAPVKVTN